MMNAEKILDHFRVCTLTPGDMAAVILFTAAFHIAFFAVCRRRIFNRKKLAYCLTAMNAFLMFTVSLFYITVKYKMGHNVFDFHAGKLEWWTGRDNISASVLIMFGTANVMDILLGWFFYREHLYPLTTWVHHSVYIWLMVFLVTGDGYIVTLPYPYTPAFMCALVEELPTFILAIGTIFPQFRQDLAFGLTFFVTRILFHSYLIVYMFRLQPPVVITICYLNPLLLHLHWFYGWFSKYAFDKNKKVLKEKDKKI
jgi:hypothetical protein